MPVKNNKAIAKQRSDSPEYLARKAFYKQLITVYGRKPVIEVLRDRSLKIYRIHLASSNRDSGVIGEIKQLASERDVEMVFHSRDELSRISRNSKQDQGVACDIHCPGLKSYQQMLTEFESNTTQNKRLSLIALDGVTNPQNLGMIIRSVTASPAQGLLLPSKGNSDISPLVIKASAGTVFKGDILRCDCLIEALRDLQKCGFTLCTLSSYEAIPINDFKLDKPTIFILGNESQGVSQKIIDMSDYSIGIPMANGVESLNVAVAAALVAFHSY